MKTWLKHSLDKYPDEDPITVLRRIMTIEMNKISEHTDRMNECVRAMAEFVSLQQTGD